MAKIQVQFDDKNLRKQLKTFENDLNRKVIGLMNYESAYTVGWLKTNAPWNDDTGAARSGLNTMYFNKGTNHEILMSYSVYYGIWLEVAHSGQWAIITPAMRIVGAKIMNDIQKLINASFRSNI